MKAAIIAVPPPDEKPRRRSRWTKADREMLRELRAIISEFANGMPIFKRRSELRGDAHRSVTKWLDAKVAGK